ncbi:ubiquitin-like protein ATG12 [Aplysia californica]|uniref:Ubiquitin-like protein ATG12 n=1 Tax=Aplysia californica TaxID=6500 RepID=A0ABM0JFH6_APLCA|nr:ubiquitin-like protein ATG12 [Aplysia californica]
MSDKNDDDAPPSSPTAGSASTENAGTDGKSPTSVDSPSVSPAPGATASTSSKLKSNSLKVDILLKPAGDAPIMKKKKWTVDRTKKISWVSDFIKKYIKSEASESLFLYVNQAFAPSPDTDIGSIFDCFGSDGKLVLHYCRTQAWG